MIDSLDTLGRWLLRLVLATLLLTLALAGGFLLWLLFPVLADPVPGFEERRGALAAVEETSRREHDGATLVELTLRSTSGLQVELALRKPHDLDPEQPMLLMLGGQETGRAAVEVLPQTYGVPVAALSYPFPTIPHREGLAMLQALRGVQRGILDVPPSVMLAIDYLQTRPDLSRELELAGISFGAYIAAVPAVLDPRVQRLWLIHGSTDPVGVIERGLEGRLGPRPLRRLVAWSLASAAGAHHLGPDSWVARMSPRPVVVISARDDSALPPGAVMALHDRLRAPAEVHWTEGDHVHPKRPEVVGAIVDLMFSRIAAR